nr:MAG TPA: hypothetical protein [Caudoviricetes sp.]
MSSKVIGWTISFRSPRWRRYFAMRRWRLKRSAA